MTEANTTHSGTPEADDYMAELAARGIHTSDDAIRNLRRVSALATQRFDRAALSASQAIAEADSLLATSGLRCVVSRRH